MSNSPASDANEEGGAAKDNGMEYQTESRQVVCTLQMNSRSLGRSASRATDGGRA